jgi:hypothetical protein
VEAIALSARLGAGLAGRPKHSEEGAIARNNLFCSDSSFLYFVLFFIKSRFQEFKNSFSAKPDRF